MAYQHYSQPAQALNTNKIDIKEDNFTTPLFGKNDSSTAIIDRDPKLNMERSIFKYTHLV